MNRLMAGYDRQRGDGILGHLAGRRWIAGPAALRRSSEAAGISAGGFRFGNGGPMSSRF